MASTDRFDEWYHRIAREFSECPGLRLTDAQAARLWALDRESIEELLAALVRDRLLTRRANGTFASTARCPTCRQ